MLIDIVRHIIPDKSRQIIGTKLLNIVCKNKLLLKPYIKLLYGYSVNKLRVLSEYSEFEYKDRIIKFPHDGIGSVLEVFYDDVYDQEFCSKADDIVFDIGAYVGMWSIKQCLRDCYVIAFEPIEKNLKYLYENTTGLDISINDNIVSDKTGIEKIYTNSNSSCSSIYIKDNKNKSILKECVSIDDLGIIPDFIKLDAEGAELKVLKGAINTLTTFKVKLSIACYKNLPDNIPGSKEIIKFLTDIGYNTKIKEGLRVYIYAWKD